MYFYANSKAGCTQYEDKNKTTNSPILTSSFHGLKHQTHGLESHVLHDVTEGKGW